MKDETCCFTALYSHNIVSHENIELRAVHPQRQEIDMDSFTRNALDLGCSIVDAGGRSSSLSVVLVS